MADIGLVGCSRRKLDHPAPARELYASPLFRLASRYCSAVCHRWFVLSARHGLVDPEQIIEPYDVTLARLIQADREAWACRVVEQLRQRGLLGKGHRFLLHAGANYTDLLATRLGAEQPLRGLTIGRRLAWYRRALATLTPKEDRSWHPLS
jgi:hypothetical protein